jgi:hypothetical protein
VHYYAAGYYYAAKNKGIAMTPSAQALDSFASAAPGSNIKFSSGQKLHAAYPQGERVASSWSLYSGQIDSR